MKRRSSVLTVSTHERLAEMRRQIDELEANARPGTAGAQPRIQRQLDALRRQEAAARAVARGGEDAFEEKFEEFEARLRVARSALAAELAESPRAFANALEDELATWDDYVERLQAQVALRAATARAQAEAEISEVRRRRNDVAAQLADVRAVNGGAWDELREQVADARDRLEQTADQVSARFT
jgi:chromosome segregation ATPase